MKMYFCTTFGDINIEQKDRDLLLATSRLSYGERMLVKEILKEYKVEFSEEEGIEDKSFIITERKIEDVQKFMKKKLKKDKPTLTALKFKDGRIELSEEVIDKKEAESGVTVERPTRGCPMPAAIAGEIRASKVLKEFLSKQQNIDFEKHLQFIAVGNYTKIPYLITSRWCKLVEKVGQVFDLVNWNIICANCMEIPPSEEMWSLKLMLEHKEREFLVL